MLLLFLNEHYITSYSLPESNPRFGYWPVRKTRVPQSYSANGHTQRDLHFELCRSQSGNQISARYVQEAYCPPFQRVFDNLVNLRHGTPTPRNECCGANFFFNYSLFATLLRVMMRKILFNLLNKLRCCILTAKSKRETKCKRDCYNHARKQRLHKCSRDTELEERCQNGKHPD